MALETNELFREVTQSAFPRIKPVHVYSKKVGTITGAPVLAVGHPMAYDTTAAEWVRFDANGANGADVIRGFVYPDPIASSASDEVLGQIMVAGEIHRDDVALGAEAQADVDTALKANLAAAGLYVTGLAGVS